jgi:dTDP-4-amino-4,6-dideoxygalactose transaminase
MGRVMLKKLDGWVEQRRSYAHRLTRGFENLPGLRVTRPKADVYHAYYKYYVFIRAEELKESWNRDRVIEHLNRSGVPCHTGICPEIYREKAFENSGCRLHGSVADHAGSAFLQVARHLGETSVMFMVHPTLTRAAVQYVIDQVTHVMTQAAG